MDVFAFRDELVAEYSKFSRSFTRIRAEDISRAVDAAYDVGRFARIMGARYPYYLLADSPEGQKKPRSRGVKVA